MNTFPIHTPDTAPAGSQPALRGLQEAVGLVPNLAAMMANSPPLVNAFVASVGHLASGTLTDGERQTVLLTNAVANDCAWAVAFHTAQALKAGVDAANVEAMRHRRPPAEPRLAALSTLARRLIETRGHLDETDLTSFTAAGFRADQALEVITGVAISAMANYAGNVARPPLDEPFRAHAWSDEERRY